MTPRQTFIPRYLGWIAATTALAGAFSALGQNGGVELRPRPPIPAPDGQTLDAPTGEYRNIDLRSGPVVNAAKNPRVVWQDQLQVVNAAWLRLYFDDTRLAEGSFIRITSDHDGEVQELDSSQLTTWGYSSAYFNGNSVKIELIAGPATFDNRVRITEYAFERGRANFRGEGNCGICGPDDRVPSSDNNFGRLFPVGCSATIFNEEGCLVTAGHCLGQGGVVQFNVPPSNSDGSTNNPPVVDQFPVVLEGGTDAGVGADYGAVLVGPNSNGNLPHLEYGTFIPIASSIPSSGTLSVRGYGVDSGNPERSQTQQFHDGPLLSLTSTAILFDIDITFGNSGSSIIYNGEIVGVVSHCSGACENYGNRVDDPAFVQVRTAICSGEAPPCGPTESEDCNGNCYPSNWLGDGTCDDGSFTYNGVPIFLNCDQLGCDNGDCICNSSGACCLPDNSCQALTQTDCEAQQGTFQGDGVVCDQETCETTVSEGNTCAEAVPATLGANLFDTSTLTDSQYGLPDASQCPDTFLDWTNPDTNVVSPDQWLSWTAPGNGLATFSTCDSTSFDTSMVLYQGSTCGSLTQVACNGDAAEDQSCQQYHSEIQYQVTSGQTYFVRLAGWQAATGAGTLTISGSFTNDPLGACCLPDVPCDILLETECDAAGGTFQGAETTCNGDPCGTSLGFAYVITGTNLVDTSEPNFTADLYVTTPSGSRVNALAGTADLTKTLTSTGGFYQNTFGGPTSLDVNPNLYGFFPDLRYDSRVTIGALDSSGAPFGANALQSTGIDFGPFEQGLGLSANNGLWFVLPTDPQGASQSLTAQDCSIRDGVLVAQVTLLGLDSVVTFEAFVQGSLPGGDVVQGPVSGSFGYSTTEDCNTNQVPDACDIANGTSLDENSDGIPDECGCNCPADATGDCLVTVDDLLLAIGNFGQSGPNIPGDINGDGTVTVDDILLIIQFFGSC